MISLANKAVYKYPKHHWILTQYWIILIANRAVYKHHILAHSVTMQMKMNHIFLANRAVYKYPKYHWILTQYWIISIANRAVYKHLILAHSVTMQIKMNHIFWYLSTVLFAMEMNQYRVDIQWIFGIYLPLYICEGNHSILRWYSDIFWVFIYRSICDGNDSILSLYSLNIWYLYTALYLRWKWLNIALIFTKYLVFICRSICERDDPILQWYYTRFTKENDTFLMKNNCEYIILRMNIYCEDILRIQSSSLQTISMSNI